MKRDPAFNAPYVRLYLGAFSFFTLWWILVTTSCFGIFAVWLDLPVEPRETTFSDWAIFVYLVFVFATSCFTYLRGYLLLGAGAIMHFLVLPVIWKLFEEHFGGFEFMLLLTIIGWWYMAIGGLFIKKPS